MNTPNDEHKNKINPDEPIHEVDGIVELNHPAPMWWQTIFYISIVWAVGYGWYYLFGGGPTLSEELQVKLQNIENLRAGEKTASAGNDANELDAAYKAPEKLAAGKIVFARTCASCHADDGGGNIGPNLADAHWIHGNGTLQDIAHVVQNGVAEKGMPPWGPVLKHDELINVSAFVRYLRGSHPAKPKAPQGEAKTFTEGS